MLIKIRLLLSSPILVKSDTNFKIKILVIYGLQFVMLSKVITYLYLYGELRCTFLCE